MHNLETIYYKIQSFEKIIENKDFSINNLPVWELLRFQIYQECCYKAGLFKIAHNPTQINIKNVYRYIKNNLMSTLSLILNKNKSDCDLLICGHPRLVKNSNNYWEDPYTEAYIDQTKFKKIYIEKSFRGKYYKPRKNMKRIKFDLIFNIANFAKEGLSKHDNNKIEYFENLFQLNTGAKIEFRNKIQNALSRRKILLPFFKYFMDQLNPKIAFVSQSYLQPFFIEACRREKIPIVEIQHGIISRYHLGYNYETYMPKIYFPDYIWLWGHYWEKSIKFPRKTKKRIVGSPIFEYYRNFNSLKKLNACLFISQGTIGHTLSKHALQLRKKIPTIPIYFKLHPSEYDYGKSKYYDLTLANIQILSKESGSIYNWLKKVKYVIGGYSTAIFEAIGMGCKVGVINIPGIEHLDNIIKMNGIFVLEKDFKNFFNDMDGSRVDINSIFRPFKKDTINETLKTDFNIY